MKQLTAVLACAALFHAGSALSTPATARGGKPDVRAHGPDTSRVHIGPEKAGTTAYVAWPTGDGPAPGVIVVHEWWGLNGQIREIARRFARQGYVAIVPDLYHGKVAGDAELAHELARGLETDRALDELEAAAEWLRGQGRTAKSRIGVIGFCMGGSLSQKLAMRGAGLAAAVMFYGRPETDSTGLAGLAAPLQAHFGAADQGIPLERVEQLKAGLKRAGKAGEVHVYPSAGHAFMNEGRPSYHADAARQAWARTLAFFQRHLKS